MSESTAEHRRDAPTSLAVAVVTVSDTRTLADDHSGALILNHLGRAGHRVADRRIVRDEPDQIGPLLDDYAARPGLDAVLLTGGTGISVRDRTYETIAGRLTRPLPGFGELFRMLSYAEIGPACLLSRAVGGLMGRLVVLSMPGSRAAVELAMARIIVPELPHIVREARRGGPADLS